MNKHSEFCTNSKVFDTSCQNTWLIMKEVCTYARCIHVTNVIPRRSMDISQSAPYVNIITRTLAARYSSFLTQSDNNTVSQHCIVTWGLKNTRKMANYKVGTRRDQTKA